MVEGGQKCGHGHSLLRSKELSCWFSSLSVCIVWLSDIGGFVGCHKSGHYQIKRRQSSTAAFRDRLDKANCCTKKKICAERWKEYLTCRRPSGDRKSKGKEKLEKNDGNVESSLDA